MSTKELVARLRKASRAIYLATEEAVADDISSKLTRAADTIERLERERDEARAKGEATARLALSLEVEADERIAVAETEASTLRACVEKTSSMVRELLAIHEAHHNHPSHAAARRLLAALTEEPAS